MPPTGRPDAHEEAGRHLPYDAEDVVTAIGQAVIVTDPAGVIRSWNPAAERLYGWSEHEARGQDVIALTVPEVSRRDAEDIFAALRTGEAWSGSFTVRHQDGSVFQALVTDTSVRDSSGAVVAVVGISGPLGEAVRPLLENSIDAATVVGTDGLIRFASPAVTNVFGWSADELNGQPAVSLLHPDDGPLLERVLRRCGNGAGHSPLELRVRTRDGSWRWAEAVVSDLVSDPGVRGVVINLRDVTDRRAAHERLSRLALYDPLTGLPNRTLLATRVRHAHARRGQAGALLLIDLDDFKSVNRTLGHAAGDELLRTLAARLDAAVGVADTCARLSGDELVVLAEGVSEPDEALELASRLQLLLGRSARAGGATVNQSASVGVTLLSGRRRAGELLRECVAAVYDAKQSGHAKVAMFDSVGAERHAVGGLVKRLRQGLHDGELRVLYQPVVDLGSHDVVGVEALVRWEHPTRGLLPAEAFIEAVENDDLIHDIGAHVLSRACHQVARWPGSELVLSVNVSARQISEHTFAQTVRECLDSSGLAPERLVLEITETALMQDLATALQVIAACREHGVRISLDDFGTGFAGFGYLRELPVDEVKIDRSFITGMTANSFDTAIIRGIVEMAKGLGLATTGEGVETARQARLLAELGCDRAQGFLWSPAVPADERAPDISGRPAVPVQRDDTESRATP